MDSTRDLLEGSATPAGTASYASRFAGTIGATGYTLLGSTGLTASRVGFGGYRVDDETSEHREALEKALLNGSNLIDTSTNYTDGGSERLIGMVVNDLLNRQLLRREEVIVVSKIGYVQGSNLALAQEREPAGRPFPEMVKYAEECWHCIHPEFIEDQLARSLERLGLSTLDVCLLHNPEYFFSDAKKRDAGPLGGLRDEFYRRLREAFSFLESQVAAGIIHWYGVSSNTVTSSANNPEATSLTLMLQAARDAGGADHHFSVLQLPMNLFESGAVLERNNGPENRETVLETAAREGIAVLVNRPLNAMVGAGMLRLADTQVGEAEVDLDHQLKVVADLEALFQREIAPNIQLPHARGSATDLFRWATQLDGFQDRIQGLEHWHQVMGQMIVPQVTQAAKALNGIFKGAQAEQWKEWWNRYFPELRELLAELGRRAALKNQAQSLSVASIIDPLLPPERRGEILSRKALWILASTSGVSSVLNGMRHQGYVDDALGILSWPPLGEVVPIYEAIQKNHATR